MTFTYIRTFSYVYVCSTCNPSCAFSSHSNLIVYLVLGIYFWEQIPRTHWSCMDRNVRRKLGGGWVRVFIRNIFFRWVAGDFNSQIRGYPVYRQQVVGIRRLNLKIELAYGRELLRVLKKGSNPQEEKSDLQEEKNPQEVKKNPQEEKKNPQEEKVNRWQFTS